MIIYDIPNTLHKEFETEKQFFDYTQTEEYRDIVDSIVHYKDKVRELLEEEEHAHLSLSAFHGHVIDVEVVDYEPENNFSMLMYRGTFYIEDATYIDTNEEPLDPKTQELLDGIF